MTTFIRRPSRLAVGLGVAGAAVLLLAGPAAADTSQARATAAVVNVLGSPIVDTGVFGASNDGTTETTTGTGGIVLLGGQTVITTGVLAQDATARNNGTSGDCAGAVGSGGQLQVGAAPGCTATIGAPGGVTLNLSPGLATLAADAIFAQCEATTAGETGSATLANATISVLGAPLPITLSAAPAPNQGLNVPGVANLVLNQQINNPDGSLTVNALRITLLSALGAPLADVIIGSVTCGPNAVAPAISIFNGPAVPMALAGAMAVGTGAVVRRRRQAA